MESSWEAHKEELRHLFLTQDKTLPEVMIYMENRYNFHPSKAQYERYFKKWKLRKNLKQSEWKFVHHRLEKRKREAKASDMYVDGVFIPRKKISREASRHSFQTIQERFSQESSPRTPEGVYVCTPPSVSINQHFLCNLPWFQLQRSTIPISIPSVDLAAVSSHLISSMTDDVRSISQNKTFLSSDADTLNSALTSLVECTKSNRPKLAQDLHSHLRSIVPESINEIFAQDHTTTLSAVRTGINGQTVSLILYLMSNNMMNRDGSLKVLQFFNCKSGKELLKLVLCLKELTVEAFAEQLFVIAVQEKDIAIVQILLDYGIQPNSWSLPYDPIQYAADMDNFELVQILLDAGADVNAPPTGMFGRTALQAACENRNIELVQILLDAGADFNAPPADMFDRTALQTACENRNIELVQILLAAGADVNVSPVYDNGRTALQAACMNEDIGIDIELVQILLAAGADVNAPPANDDGRTALQAACMNNDIDIEVVQILLVAGADVNAPPANDQGRTALQAACMNEDIDIEVVQILLAAGADVNTPPANDRGRTALQAACVQDNLELVQILLAAGADVNTPPARMFGRTALQAACEMGNIELARILLDAGADVNAPPADIRGATAMQFSVINGFFGIAIELLDSGADLNAMGSRIDGRTALEGAAENGRIDMIQWLLNAGVESGGGEASELALREGHCAAKKIIESHFVSSDMRT